VTFKIAVVFCLLLVGLAILFPITGGEIHTSPKTQCLSNLKQNGLAFAMYANDYDDRFPPSKGWMDLLKPYTKSEQILHCPLLMPKNWKPEDDLTKVPYGYAMNRFLALANDQKLAEPDKMPLAYETTDLGRSASGYLTDVPNPGRHAGKNIFVFADFHAKALGSNPP